MIMTTLKSMPFRLVLVIGVCVACVCSASAADTAALDALFEQLGRYELSSSPVPLEQLRSRVRASHGKSEQRRDLERRMVAVLENAEATDEGRRFLCQQLAIVGTDRSVPVLGRLLRDAELGRHACYALRGIDTAPAGAALRGALADAPPKVRLDIIQALSQRGEPDSVPMLIALLASNDRKTAHAAATALGTFGGTRAADALRGATARIPAELLNHCRLQCAQALGEGGKSEAALSVFQELYAGDVPLQVRRGAMLGTIHLGGEEGTRFLLDVLQGGNAELRLAAVSNGLRLLGEQRSAAALDLVMACLPKVPADEQVVWLRELTAQCGFAMTPHLRTLARHDSRDVRATALRGLVQLEDVGAVPVLMQALHGETAERKLALSGLRKVKGNGVAKAITDALPGSESSLQVQIIGVLRDRGEESAVPALMGLTEHENEKVAAAAFQALGDLADSLSLSELVDRVLVLKNVAVADRSGVRAVLSIARRHEAQERLLGELRKRSVGRIGITAYCRILRIVSALPDARSVQMLREAKGSGDSPVRDVALRGLVNHPHVAALPELQRMIETPDSDKYRVLAMRGMVRLLRSQSGLDQKQRLQYYKLLVGKAQSDGDWNLVLSGLAELPPRAALRLMLPHAEADSPKQELAVAIDRAIARMEPTALCDGKTFEGWEGNLKLFRIEDGAIVSGSLAGPVPRNEYLCSTRTYSDFELRLKFKVLGKNTNAGIQMRSERVPNSNEMIGYQADLGQTWWGCLYDERRHKCLVKVAPKVQSRLIKKEQWNDYVIRCHGRRVQLWVNGEKTVDYTEPDKSIPQTGVIGLQIHKGQPGEAWYKDIRLIELP